jgi:hypothetical protein
MIDIHASKNGVGSKSNSEGIQDSGKAYTRPQADSIRKFSKSIFHFYLKALIQFCSELNSLSNGI